MLTRCNGCQFNRGDSCARIYGEGEGERPQCEYIRAPRGYWNEIAADCLEKAIECGEARRDYKYSCGDVYNVSEVVYMDYYGEGVPAHIARRAITAIHEDGEEVQILDRDTIRSNSDGARYTPAGAAAFLEVCEECGGYYDPDDLREVRGQLLCDECAEDYAIDGYHENKRNYTRRGAAPWFGGEFEFERNGGAPIYEAAEAVRAIAEAAGFSVYLEHDGSLDDGFEMITDPLERGLFERFPLEAICDALRGFGYRSHDGGACGFHMHVDASAFGTTADEQALTIGEIMRFYTRHADALRKFSRRGNKTGYCKFDSFYNYAYGEDERASRSAAYNKRGADRYTAINCNNWDSSAGRGTIEFRACRGSLHAPALRAWFEFHAELVSITREKGRAPAFLDVLFRCSDDTVKYMESRGAAEMEV